MSKTTLHLVYGGALLVVGYLAYTLLTKAQASAQAAGNSLGTGLTNIANSLQGATDTVNSINPFSQVNLGTDMDIWNSMTQ